jgi:hypothetical protein
MELATAAAELIRTTSKVKKINMVAVTVEHGGSDRWEGDGVGVDEGEKKGGHFIETDDRDGHDANSYNGDDVNAGVGLHDDADGIRGYDQKRDQDEGSGNGGGGDDDK